MSTTTPPGTPPGFDIKPVAIEDEMKRSYLDYAMSVIVARALPDVRDGLKPVHRRILYAMKDGGYDWSKPYRKSARIVGDVMGKYHPHGDSAIYDAMVRMAQDFSMRLPLIDGQGNFGSMDGDPPAAMRYTEARLAKAAEALLRDIDKETVQFVANYDESIMEPAVLPAEYPNLLVNGAGGIAVGMATNIPPHNLGEVIDACCAYVDNPGITVEALMEHVPGPDFPTGGIIVGKRGTYEAHTTGRGSVIMRGRVRVEEVRKDREALIISEIPYQVNKSRLIERIAEVVNQKIVEGISDIRDESDRDGVRVVVEIKRDAQADVVLNQLYRFTPLQTSFGVNALALNGGRPEMMNLRDFLVAFIKFREEVITRRTVFELGKARDRAHTLVGLLVALQNLDPMIDLIRASRDAVQAREALMGREWEASDAEPYIRLIDEPGRSVVDGKYRLSEAQAKAILELRLQRLTGMEREKLVEETNEIAAKIEEYLAILGSREKLMSVMREEFVRIKEQFATPRRTTLEEGELDQDIEDLIQREDMVVTVSRLGYIKRVPLSTYRAQRRGGKGRSGMTTRDEDFVSRVFVANTHTPMLFFTSRGMVYQLKVWQLPLATPQGRGKPIVNLLPVLPGEGISTIMPLPADEESWGDLHAMFATSGGTVRRNALSDFTNIKSNGKIAMKLGEGEHLVGVMTCNERQDVLLSTHNGQCIRFQVTDVREFKGRDSMGVRGIRLLGDDRVISLSILNHVDASMEERTAYLRRAGALRRQNGEDGLEETPDSVEVEEMEEALSESLPATLTEQRFAELAALEEFILTVSEKGYGKRSSAYEYRVTGRGGQGIANMEVNARNGRIAASFPVAHTDQIMLVTDSGQLIRSPVHDIRIAGRRTQGVILFRVAEDENVVSVAWLAEESGAEDEAIEGVIEGEGTVGDDGTPGEESEGGSDE
ncbi:DNA gyrase subunit A [Oceanibaculum pacificum]|uniref:DNA gyrase subunit A n=1 Tax=Oceanibaculum pacificum TaxID=580166 RepID=A0A154VR22_9PROT|nr:DNA gyrase subunit A [Oceanibaculum pacificum]KZD03715.1 DNA gyrase subunit A [Oceanibaculum pacificum]